MNATTGTIVAQTTASPSGSYSFSLPAGTYTMSASYPGYGACRTNTAVIGGQTTGNVHVNLVPAGPSNEIRIVLSWGQFPSDLNSYLFMPGGSYVARDQLVQTSANGQIRASLDQDVTTGFGPETITIPVQENGTYRYAVHNRSGTPTLTASNATVRVYRGGIQIGEFHAPGGNQSGSVWHVFNLSGTTLTAMNSISNGFPGPAMQLGDDPETSVVKVPDAF
jgi:hypothetical protein